MKENFKQTILKEGTKTICRKVNGSRFVAGERFEQRQESSLEGTNEERTSFNMAKVVEASDLQLGGVDQT